jgi:hypothetical protein
MKRTPRPSGSVSKHLGPLENSSDRGKIAQLSSNEIIPYGGKIAKTMGIFIIPHTVGEYLR